MIGRRRNRFAHLTVPTAGAILLLTFGAGTARAASGSASPVTFTKDIAPLMFNRCGTCHRPGGVAPFSLITYASVRQRATQIAAVTKNRVMPPWKSEPGYGEFIGQPVLTDAEIDVIQQWIDEGAVEGPESALPPLPQWTDGWQLGMPDLVVRPSHSYTLPAGGRDVFSLFVIPIPTEVVRYVRGVEFRPENTRAIHHATILLDRTRTSRERNEQDPSLGERGLLPRTAEYPAGYFLGWTPGSPEALLPKGLAWTLEPNTDLVVQLHLQPTGKSETVEFSVGLFFGTDPPTETPALLRLGRQGFEIPAGDSRYTVEDSYTLPVDLNVLALKPHAHYRAHEVQGYATLPDGTTKWLLRIRDWDFRWQNVYRFVTPVALPKGTTLTMQYTYDNSAANARNPQQPPQRVRWGPRSFDEMGDLWIQVLTHNDRDLATLNADIGRKVMVEDLAGYSVMIEANPDDAFLRDDAGLINLQLGRPQAAIAHFQASAELKPASAVAHFNLAAAHMQAGNREAALSEYQSALRLDPKYAAAHNNLGSLLDDDGKLDEALEEFRETLRLDPNHAGAYNNIAFILMRRGKMDEALSYLREALRIDPGLALAHYNMGVVMQRQGNPSEAIARFRDALRIRPDWAPVLSDLAWVLATTADDQLRNAPEAISLAEQAAVLTSHRNVDALDALAAACAAAGEFGRAAKAIQEAIALKPPPPLAGALLKRQELYRANKPYRENGAAR